MKTKQTLQVDSTYFESVSSVLGGGNDMFEFVTNLDGDLYSNEEGVWMLITDKPVYGVIIRQKINGADILMETSTVSFFDCLQSKKLKDLMSKILSDDAFNAYIVLARASQNVKGLSVLNREMLELVEMDSSKKVPNDSVEFEGLLYKIDIEKLKKKVLDDDSMMSLRSPSKTRIK